MQLWNDSKSYFIQPIFQLKFFFDEFKTGNFHFLPEKL